MRLFTERELKLFFLIFAGALIVAVLITVIVGSTGRSRRLRSVSEPAEIRSIDVDTADLVIPEDYFQVYEHTWHPYRTQNGVWTDELIKMHWIDTREILIDHYRQQSDVLIESILNRGAAEQ